jgi:glycosyltransferase involved in cell wall biosynthesis
MKISYHTVKDNLDVTRGFGAAGFNLIRSLQKQGHTVLFDDASAPVQISFCQPTWYNFHPGQYKIGYTPWESTELPHGWKEAFNKCDEVWATSEWVANVYRNAGVTVPVKVYEHGLESKWEPMKRENDGVTRFLHMGEPALRKGGQLAIDAFRAVFGDREDVHLTIKSYYAHYLRVWSEGDVVLPETSHYKNVTVITDMLYHDELMDLYANSDVMVYPSYGEGFGLIPLQALGTGLPVICTDDWASYRKFLGPLVLRGRYERSIWAVHPGNVYYPDYESLKGIMRFAHENIDWLHDYYYDQAADVHKMYDWDEKTRDAFAHIVKMFSV